MTEIKPDSRNYRIHDDRNKELIRKSLKEYGTGRSIVIDSDGEIIAGNGVYEQAKVLNIPIKEIETDGSELVVIKRTDLKRDDEKRNGLAIMDNSTTDSSRFDVPLLQTDFNSEYLQSLGVPVFDASDIDVDGFFKEKEEEKETKPKTMTCPYCGKEFEV